MRAFALAMALALIPPGGAHAQQRAPAPEAPAAAQPPAPYEPQLLRLSEIMGALAWLRDLCGSKDGDQWRTRMNALLEAEAQTQPQRERLAGAYNRGFRSYEAVYRSCTPNAEIVIDRYLDEGGRIAREVTSRFSGG